MLPDNLVTKDIKDEFSVTEISDKIRNLLHTEFINVKVRGEIHDLTIAKSGHAYFYLKDANTIIATTCWRYNLSRVKFELKEGLEIVVTGKITTYAGHSKYQLSANYIDLAGEGDLNKILEERRKKLTAEGLFQQEIKQTLPLLPQKIGIITSIAGSVLRDIINQVQNRCGIHLIVWSVAVQGKNSANEVAQAIQGFNNLAHNKQPDLLIIARGGGSAEDLQAFNEEIVVRAIYHSKIPIISAIGHETDYSLADLAADSRASTPTQAAEQAVPEIKTLRYNIVNAKERLLIKMDNLIKYQTQLLLNYQRALKQVQNIIDQYCQRIDDLMFRLVQALPNLLMHKQTKLTYLSLSTTNTSKLLTYKKLQYQYIADNLANKQYKLLNPYKQKLDFNSSLLASLDYNRVLQRGYAMISDQKGSYISSIKATQAEKYITLKMHDGERKINLQNSNS